MRQSDKELRDWYAGLAMQALFSVHYKVFEGADIAEQIGQDAFDMADIMMELREEVMGND